MDRGKVDSERVNGRNVAEGVLSVLGMIGLMVFVVVVVVGMLSQAL
jgi:hypothetical protein